MEGGEETADAVEGSCGKKRGKRCDDAGILESSRRDRCRRDSMSELFSKLQSMVPSISPKASKEKFLQEASLYIRSLEEEKARLENSKMLLGAQVTTISSSISVTLSNNNLAVFAITSSLQRNLVTNIISVFDRHGAEILAANVVAQAGLMNMTVTAAVTDVAGGTVEKIKQDILML